MGCGRVLAQGCEWAGRGYRREESIQTDTHRGIPSIEVTPGGGGIEVYQGPRYGERHGSPVHSAGT